MDLHWRASMGIHMSYQISWSEYWYWGNETFQVSDGKC